MTEDPPRYMTARDIVKTVWECHPRTIKRALKAGNISGKLIGKIYWYDVQSILAYLSSTAPSAPPATPKRPRGRPRKVEVAR